LPQCNVQQTEIAVDAQPGRLWPEAASTLQDRLAARRTTVTQRCEAAAELANTNGNPWVLWCGLNAESAALAKLIPDAVEVKGSDSRDHKEDAMLGFSEGRYRVIVTKPSIAGFGMNWQHCANVAFVGLSDSWESYYQAVRRCWRFGQDRQVQVHVVVSELEGAVVKNIQRKERDAQAMRHGMMGHMREAIIGNLKGQERFKVKYETDERRGDGWTMHLGDCVEALRDMDEGSVDFSIFSPPFASLYTYSASDRDMGNVKDDDEFHEHFGFCIRELFRILKPGRLVSSHCMNLPTTKAHHGYIGIRDFRGDIIRAFLAAGFIYHSEVCIWKDPVTAMQRTKALGLLHKQLKKDAAMSRQGIPDYLVTFRKPGENPEPVTNTNKTFPVKAWQHYASPIWTDISASDTLQFRSAREHDDERHICPLQLTVIRRAIRLWTNDDDLILSPFAGIGSEGFVAIESGRRFVGIELKRSYWEQACRNLKAAKARELTLF
jgi:DNA modification methylase